MEYNFECPHYIPVELDIKGYSKEDLGMSKDLGAYDTTTTSKQSGRYSAHKVFKEVELTPELNYIGMSMKWVKS